MAVSGTASGSAAPLPSARSASRPCRAWCAALLLALGAALAAIIPPLQSPDEAAHLVRAYLLSKGQLLLERPTAPGMGSGGYVDDGLVAYGVIYDRVAAKPDRRLTAADAAEAQAVRWTGTATYIPAEGTGYYLPLAYLPHAAAFAIGERLGLTIDDTYRLVRLFAYAASLATLAFAFRVQAPNALVVMLLMLPMTAFQMVSPTLDGWTTALAVLALALFLRGMDVRYDFRPGMTGLLTACLVVVAGSRAHLLPLAVLPLLVYRVRRRPAELAGFAIASGVTLGWTLFAIRHTVVGPGRPAMTGGVLQHYLDQPLDFLRVLDRTLHDADLLEFYAKSFVGILGWLDTALPEWAYGITGYALAAAALLSLSMRSLPRDWDARAALLALALAACLLIFLALLLSWTPHPATLIAGVQGRYFLVPALMAAYALSGRDEGAGALRARAGVALLAAYGTAAAYATVEALVMRYYALP